MAEVEYSKSYYVLQVRWPKTLEWVDFPDGRIMTNGVYKRAGDQVAETTRVLAQVFQNSFPAFRVNSNDGPNYEYGITSETDAVAALALVHKVNPSPFEWRLVHRHTRVTVYEDVVDTYNRTTEWRHFIPKPEGDPCPSN